MRPFKQQNISYVVDGHCCFCNQEAANESHVFARNLPGKAMPTDRNEGRHIQQWSKAEQDFIIHSKAIDKMAWQTPALLRMRSWRIVLEIYDCWSSALIRATSVASRSICSRLLTASSPILFSPFFRCRSSKASLPFKILVTISPALTWLNG